MIRGLSRQSRSPLRRLLLSPAPQLLLELELELGLGWAAEAVDSISIFCILEIILLSSAGAAADCATVKLGSYKEAFAFRISFQFAMMGPFGKKMSISASSKMNSCLCDLVPNTISFKFCENLFKCCAIVCL